MAQLDSLLKKMVEVGASDLHLSAGEPVRLRVDGELRRFADKPLDHSMLAELMQEICRKDQWQSFCRSHDLDFAYGVKGVGRFRCNYLHQTRGPGAVFRMLPEAIQSLEELLMPPAVLELPKLRSGLLLVTGPTGSGKSTTLAAIIDRINRSAARHIVTIEDPIEFVHRDIKSYIVQREVGLHTRSFSAALRDALLQDPDVVLVGELRDLETISLAVTAAEMGVLIMGTLHTNSAAKTFDRIIDVFPPAQKDQIRSMLAESLRAIVAQTLLRLAGKPGRIAAVEVLLGGPALGAIIREGSASKILSYLESGRGRGMQTMDEALTDLVQRGVVEAREAYLKCHDKGRFETWAEKQGIALE
ncbi:MAG TPA: type IV pilus twitching motility protein PilT [Polyangia bacterium]|nr:type IV pilus twitching motility protein PilT [Polyangia bacterium]